MVSQGIFHHNELNSFNLADDLIEAYRPLIDLFVLKKFGFRGFEKEDSALSKEERLILLEVLEFRVKIKGKKFAIKNAIEITVESFIDCISKKDSNSLELPKI